MPPKKDNKEVKEEGLTAVVVVDSFDHRFTPITGQSRPWCLEKLCNVPLLHYTISWIARTECKNLILVVTKENADALQPIEQEWRHCFTELTILPSANAMSVGDALRELESRNKVHGDFLLVSNPATITSSTLKKQIARFKDLRKADKTGNVMTLIYSPLENLNQEVIAVERETNKLRLYHREEDVSRLDVDKKNFAEELVIRKDISDTGIALCSVNIAAQFSDNFDFQHTDNVIREILVNEEILLQSIHVDVLPESEAAVCVNDYDSLLFAQSLLMDHWFSPIGPDRMPIVDGHANVAIDNNTFISTAMSIKAEGLTPNFPFFEGHNVCVGRDYHLEQEVVLNNVSFGNGVKIGSSTTLLNCILGDNCRIGKNCRLSNAVIGSNVAIPDGTQLADQTIIGSDVVYPADFELPANVAVCASPLDEEDEELQVEKAGNVHLWRLNTSRTYWKYGGRKTTARDDDFDDFGVRQEPSGSESESDEEQGGEADPCAVFLEEVTDSMERIRSLPFSPELMQNLILEINSSRLANNISVDDLGKNVFLAFTSLEGLHEVKNFIELTKQWKKMFLNYYKDQDRRSHVQLLLGLEERQRLNSDLYPPARCTKIVQLLYDDLDILQEEGIISWFDSLPDSSPLKPSMKKLVDWLEESSEEDSD